MSADMDGNVRQQAEELYLRGLRILSLPTDSAQAERHRLAAGVWQQARELYRKAGDKGKVSQLDQSLAGLYKEYLLALHRRSDQRAGVVGVFSDWWMFLKVGCFGFGGPMAVFGLLENELVHSRKLLTEREFLEGAVLGDILPGPVTMDIVTYAGFKLKNWSGALISTLCFILPSFILMIVLAMTYDKYSILGAVQEVFKCLGAVVTGLILAVGLKLTKKEMTDFSEFCILLCAFIASLVFRLDIVIIVALAGLAGIVLYRDDPEKQLMEP